MNGIIPRIEVGALGGHPSFFFLFFSLLSIARLCPFFQVSLPLESPD